MRIRRRFTVQDMEDQVPFAPVALSADGHQLAILRRDSKIDVYDVRSGSVVQHLPQPPDFPYAIGISVSFSPDNSLLGVAYGGSDSFAKNSVAFFDRADGHKIRTIRNHSGLSFSPNGTKILSFGEHSLDAVDVRSGRVARVARARPTAVNLFAAWSQDGSIAAAIVRDPNWRSPCPPNVPHTDSCSNVDHEIVIVDIRSRRVRRTIGGPDQRVAQRPLTFSPGGVLIAPLGGATARYRVSNGLWSYVAPLSPLALSADGRWAVVQGCSQTSVALQDPERARAIPFAALGCR
jgi:WD40 repeat protein